MITEARALLADDKPDAAFRLVDDWIDVHERSDNPYLADAYLLRGDAWVARGNEYKALYDYEQIVRDFPASEAFPQAIDREIVIGNRYLNGLKRKIWGMRIDGARPLGEELLVRAQERMPGSELAERAALDLADHYYRERRLDMATDMYDIFLRNFPESAHREHAMERRIFANIARFKGPRYNASGLVEASALIDDYQAEYPIEAERIGLTGALESRIEESAAAQRLENARWYLRRNDLVAARIALERLVRDHRGTVAAEQGELLLVERGWMAAPAAPEPLLRPAEGDGAANGATGGGGSSAGAPDTPSAPPEQAAPPMEEMQPIGSGR